MGDQEVDLNYVHFFFLDSIVDAFIYIGNDSVKVNKVV